MGFVAKQNSDFLVFWDTLFMMHVWKIDEDLDSNKEAVERTFSGFSDALLLSAEGGRGKLICKTSLKEKK